MKIIFITLTLLLNFTVISAAENDYVKNLKTEKLFIDSLVHYDFNDSSEKYYNNNRFNNSFVSFSVGSISGNEFMQKEIVVINKKLSENILFRFDYHKESGIHLFEKKEARYFEFYRRIFRNFYLSTGFDIMAEKENIDVKGGLLYLDSMNNFFQLNVLYSDFLYDSKNHLNGKTEKSPIGIEWNGLFKFKRFDIYSSGVNGNHYKRVYLGNSLSNNLMSDEKIDDNYTNSLLFHINRSNALEISNYHENFYKKELNTSSANSIILDSTTNITTLSYFFQAFNFSSKISKSYISKSLNTLDRDESLVSFQTEYPIGKVKLKGGYVFSVYKIDTTKEIDKIILGLNYTIGQKGYVEFTAGHLNQKVEFGGGNIKIFVEF